MEFFDQCVGETLCEKLFHGNHMLMGMHCKYRKNIAEIQRTYNKYIHILIYKYLYINISIYIHIYINILIYKYIYIYIYIYAASRPVGRSVGRSAARPYRPPRPPFPGLAEGRPPARRLNSLAALIYNIYLFLYIQQKYSKKIVKISQKYCNKQKNIYIY